MEVSNLNYVFMITKGTSAEKKDFVLAKITSQSVLEAVIKTCVQKNIPKKDSIDMLIYKQNGTIMAISDSNKCYDIIESPFIGRSDKQTGLYDVLVNVPESVVYVPISPSLILTCNAVSYRSPRATEKGNVGVSIPCISDGFFVSIGAGSSEPGLGNKGDYGDAYSPRNLRGRILIMVRDSKRSTGGSLDELYINTIEPLGKNVNSAFHGKVRYNSESFSTLTPDLNSIFGNQMNNQGVFILQNIVAALQEATGYEHKPSVSLDSNWKIYKDKPFYSQLDASFGIEKNRF